MVIEIVTHCWRYWRCLTYQLSTFFYLPPPPEIQVVVSLLTCPEDEPTSRRTAELAALAWPAHVRLQVTSLPKELLFRRGIGRNMRALQTQADVVWFTDCDYLIPGTALSDIVTIFSTGEQQFVYPREVSGTTHAAGLQMILDASRWSGPKIICPEQFTEKMKNNRAIGGVQIVSGDLCRRFGYLKDSQSWLKPADRWKRAVEDVWYRKFLKQQGYPARRVDVSQVLRIRHPVAGRHDPTVEL